MGYPVFIAGSRLLARVPLYVVEKHILSVFFGAVELKISSGIHTGEFEQHDSPRPQGTRGSFTRVTSIHR